MASADAGEDGIEISSAEAFANAKRLLNGSCFDYWVTMPPILSVFFSPRLDGVPRRIRSCRRDAYPGTVP